MKISTWLVLASLGMVMTVGSACARQPAADATDTVVVTGEKPNAADRALDATRAGATAALDETKEVGAAVGTKANEAVSATGEAITDGWITTKVSTNFVDEPLLKGSDINVDTDDHIVTLTGTVGSEAGKARAAAIALGTEGVTRVVNQLRVVQ